MGRVPNEQGFSGGNMQFLQHLKTVADLPDGVMIPAPGHAAKMLPYPEMPEEFL
jgi:hypothetical protein